MKRPSEAVCDGVAVGIPLALGSLPFALVLGGAFAGRVQVVGWLAASG